MRYSLETSVEPTTEPLTLDEARLHLKIDDDIKAEDALILGLIKAARSAVENYCRRSFVQRTYVLRMDYFPAEIRLPRGPVQSITSVKYLDAGGTETTYGSSNYHTDLYSLPARIALVSGATWPQLQVGALNGVRVTYVAGYATLNAIPKDAKAAMQLLLSHFFERRSDAGPMPEGIKALLAPLEIRDFTLE